MKYVLIYRLKNVLTNKRKAPLCYEIIDEKDLTRVIELGKSRDDLRIIKVKEIEDTSYLDAEDIYIQGDVDEIIK